jgi:diaminopimelate dehydrogenase
MGQMQHTRAAIIGYGNVGRAAADALAASPDFELAGVVRRKAAPGDLLRGHSWVAPSVSSITDLEGVQAALVCVPTRELAKVEFALLESGISVVDAFDIHGEAICAHKEALQPSAISGQAVGVIASGWDPGIDSVIRALMEVAAPAGSTYTNFGPGMSMGHSVIARSVPGVEDAISITLPAGRGRHKRAVYVVPDGSRPFQDVAGDIASDPCFVDNETEVFPVTSVEPFASNVGLALIAFVVGGELEVGNLRSLPRGVIGIACIQAIGCMAAVVGVCVWVGQPLSFGLVLGAIAGATAPSTTIMITRKYRTEGPLTRALLSVVAVNDAVCLILYAVSVAVARALPDGIASQSASGVFGVFLWELFGAVVVGVVVGIAMGFFIKYVRGADELVVVVVSSVLLTAGLSSRMYVSPMISCLVLGATISNMVVGSRRLFSSVDRFSPPIYVMLFCLAGVGCSFDALSGSLGLFVAYVVARVLGKVVGAGAASGLAGVGGRIGRYMGLSLLPQAGLAAGLTVAAGVALPGHYRMLASIVIPGMLLFETVGPPLILMSLRATGEMSVEDPSAEGA